MNAVPPPAGDVVTTGVLFKWTDDPMIVALFFALAGAFFIAIYYLRRRGKK